MSSSEQRDEPALPPPGPARVDIVRSGETLAADTPDERSPLSCELADLRARLARRVAARARAGCAVVTTRHAPPAMARASAFARMQTLYLAAAGALRPGEPLNVLLVELAPHGRLEFGVPAAPDVQREWLLLRGRLTLDDGQGAVTLAPLDFHLTPSGCSATQWIEAGADSVLLFLREARHPAEPGATPRTVRDAGTPWQPFAPLVERRVLWQSGSLAALLYRAAAGARVPQHVHRHDEECLVLRGETSLDECLLREGDYQLAPAGTIHRSASTGTGSIFYIHGDLQLELIGPGA